MNEILFSSSTGDVKCMDDSLEVTEEELNPGIITKKRVPVVEGEKYRCPFTYIATY